MKFGPADANEALVFATEELKADTQYEVFRALSQAGMSQADLARKIGVSQAWVSQVLSDDANLTLESIAKIFLGLGLQCHFSVAPVEAHFAQAGVGPKLGEAAWTQPAPQDLEVLSPRPKHGQNETTTAMLMRAIRSNCRDRRRMTMVNDNGASSTKSRAGIAA